MDNTDTLSRAQVIARLFDLLDPPSSVRPMMTRKFNKLSEDTLRARYNEFVEMYAKSNELGFKAIREVKG